MKLLHLSEQDRRGIDDYFMKSGFMPGTNDITEINGGIPVNQENNEQKAVREPKLSDLLNPNEIGDINLLGFNVVVMDRLREQFPERFNESGSMDYQWFEKEIRPNYSIYLRNDVGSLSFNLLGASSTCAISCMIEASKRIMQHIQPSREMAIAITKLEEALMWMEKRDRSLPRNEKEEVKNG